jgi:hypothetical protein
MDTLLQRRASTGLAALRPVWSPRVRREPGAAVARQGLRAAGPALGRVQRSAGVQPVTDSRCPCSGTALPVCGAFACLVVCPRGARCAPLRTCVLPGQMSVVFIPEGAEARSFIASRLALTCANTAEFRVCPQVKRGQPARRGPRTQLRGTSPRRRRARLPLVLACDSCVAAPSPNQRKRTFVKRCREVSRCFSLGS